MKKLILLLIISLSRVFAEDDFLRKLQEELAKRGNPWIAGETEISKYYESLSEAEKEAFLNSLVSMGPPKKLKYSSSQRITSLDSIPKSWDWRDHDGYNWITEVREQKRCGSCWAFAWLAAWEARLNIFEKKPEREVDLSEQFIISCRRDGKRPCRGGTFYTAGEVVEHYGGAPDENCFPYTASNESCNNKCSNWKDRLYKIVNWVQEDSASDERTKELIMEGPVAAGIYPTTDFLIL